jgi:mitogen-activated protein kinase organizer 1
MHHRIVSHVTDCPGHGYDVRDVVVSADNSRFASVGGDRQLFLWEIATGQTIRKFGGHDGVINSVRFAAESEV